MIKTLILMSAILVGSSQAFAQESHQDPKPVPATTSQTERPKNEVDRRLEEAKEHGETVLGVCLENCEGKGLVGDLERGKALELPKPSYPPIARAAHVSGQVLVQVILDEEGKVIAAAAISGHPLLYGVSVAAARQSRFSPTKFNGEPVKVTGVLSYNFVPQ